MKVIDTNQTWVQELKPHQLKGLVIVEANALAAKESGIPFYTATVEDLYYSVAQAISVITQVGWELVAPLPRGNGKMQMLFKSVTV